LVGCSFSIAFEQLTCQLPDRRALLRQFAAFAAESASCWALNADGVSVRASVIICLIALHCTKFRRQRLISEQPYLALQKYHVISVSYGLARSLLR
jgi:hypothetical protein